MTYTCIAMQESNYMQGIHIPQLVSATVYDQV